MCLNNKILLYVIVFSMFGLNSCKPKAERTSESLAEFFKDSVSLNIEGGNLDELFMKGSVDHRVYYRAVKRMNQGLSIQGDTLYCRIKNGAEVKISENLYDYLTFIWRLENKKLKTDTIYEIRKTVEEGIYFVARKDTPENIGVRIYK